MDFTFFLENYYQSIDFKYSLIIEQIENKDDNYTTMKINILAEMEEIFNELKDLTYSGDDDSTEIDNAKEYFYKLCLGIVHAIEEKYNIDADDVYITETNDRLLGVCKALYSFFVLNTKDIISGILSGYIRNNLFELYEVFKGVSQSKDSVSLSNKKVFSEGMTLILSNIYDIADYVLSHLDYKSADEYIKNNFPPYEVIKSLYKADMLDGDYMRSFADIFKMNITLKSMVCFDIMSMIKNKEIDDIFDDIAD